MSLVTRCPSCATTFRVLPSQLAIRGGKVRCGKCSSIFDGVAGLLTEEAAAALPDEPSPQLGLFEGRESFSDSPAEESLPVAAAFESMQPEPPVTEFHAPEEAPKASVPVQELPGTIVTQTAGLTPKRAKEDDVVPAFMEQAPPASTHFAVWFLLSFILLVALATQASLHFRTEVAVLVPQARPFLETACEILGCQMRLPRRPDLLSIESSDLQADGQRQGVIVLNALLRNRAPFSQEFPDLELTLTDQGERAVIRKVLKPRDYLQERKASSAHGMAPGTEEAVRIFLDTGGLLATGYQLFLFFPCPPASSSAFWQLSYPSRCQDSGNK